MVCCAPSGENGRYFAFNNEAGKRLLRPRQAEEKVMFPEWVIGLSVVGGVFLIALRFWLLKLWAVDRFKPKPMPYRIKRNIFRR